MKNFNLTTRFLFINLFFLGSVISVNAQVGIGTTSPQSTLDIVGDPTDSAVLDGVIAPRITGDQLSAKTYTTAQTAAVVYVTAADGTPTGQTVNVTQAGYYYFNGEDDEWIALSPAEDGDFFDVLTSAAPTAITQDVYRTGNVGIGQTTASYPLEITNSSTTRGASILTNGTTAGVNYSLYLNNENTSSGTDNRFGIYSRVRVPGSQSNSAFGTWNELTYGSGTGDHFGTYNKLYANVSRKQIGLNNWIYGGSSGNGEHIGVINNLTGSGSGTHTGTQNQMKGGTGYLRGVYNLFNIDLNGTHRGIDNQISNNGSGSHQGMYTSISGTGDGAHTGVSNYIYSTGTGAHTGVSNTLIGTGSGTQTGMYNNINSSTGNNFGARTEIDNTASTKTSYGTYNWLSNNAGTAYGGWFDITSGAGDAYGAWFSATGSGTNYAAVFNDGLVVINESGNDNDFRVESDDNENMIFVDANNNEVGIGTNNPREELEVVGSIRFSNQMKRGGTILHPDHVFESYYEGVSIFNPVYKIQSLEEVEAFVKENMHLPNVQSRADVIENDWDMSEGVRVNLEKVEELFLHAIEANKKIEKLKAEKESMSIQLKKAILAIEQLNYRIEKLEEN